MPMAAAVKASFLPDAPVAAWARSPPFPASAGAIASSSSSPAPLCRGGVAATLSLPLPASANLPGPFAAHEEVQPGSSPAAEDWTLDSRKATCFGACCHVSSITSGPDAAAGPEACLRDCSSCPTTFPWRLSGFEATRCVHGAETIAYLGPTRPSQERSPSTAILTDGGSTSAPLHACDAGSTGADDLPSQPSGCGGVMPPSEAEGAQAPGARCSDDAQDGPSPQPRSATPGVSAAGCIRQQHSPLGCRRRGNQGGGTGGVTQCAGGACGDGGSSRPEAGSSSSLPAACGISGSNTSHAGSDKVTCRVRLGTGGEPGASGAECLEGGAGAGGGASACERPGCCKCTSAAATAQSSAAGAAAPAFVPVASTTTSPSLPRTAAVAAPHPEAPAGPLFHRAGADPLPLSSPWQCSDPPHSSAAAVPGAAGPGTEYGQGGALADRTSASAPEGSCCVDVVALQEPPLVAGSSSSTSTTAAAAAEGGTAIATAAAAACLPAPYTIGWSGVSEASACLQPQLQLRTSQPGDTASHSSSSCGSIGGRMSNGGVGCGGGGCSGTAWLSRRPAYGVKQSQITSQMSAAHRTRAAVVIQAAWRGFRIRRLYLRLIVWRLRPPVGRPRGGEADSGYLGLREFPAIPDVPPVSLFARYGRPSHFRDVKRRVWFGLDHPFTLAPSAAAVVTIVPPHEPQPEAKTVAAPPSPLRASSSTVVSAAAAGGSDGNGSAAEPTSAAAELPPPPPPALRRQPLRPLRVPARAEADVSMSEVERILDGGFWKDDPAGAAGRGAGRGGGGGGGGGGEGDGGGEVGLSLFMRARMRQEEREAEEALQMLSYEPHDLKHLLGSLKERTLGHLSHLGRTIGGTLAAAGLARSLPKAGRWGAGGEGAGGGSRNKLFCGSAQPNSEISLSFGASRGGNSHPHSRPAGFYRSLGGAGAGGGGSAASGGPGGGLLGWSLAGIISGGGAAAVGGSGGGFFDRADVCAAALAAEEGSSDWALRVPLLTVVDPEGRTHTEEVPQQGGAQGAVPIAVNWRRYRSRSHVSRMSF